MQVPKHMLTKINTQQLVRNTHFQEHRQLIQKEDFLKQLNVADVKHAVFLDLVAKTPLHKAMERIVQPLFSVDCDPVEGESIINILFQMAGGTDRELSKLARKLLNTLMREPLSVQVGRDHLESTVAQLKPHGVNISVE